MKSHIRKVNSIIEETCNEITGMISDPSTNNNYSPEDFKVTCDFISKLARDILAALDEPLILQPYFDKINVPIKFALNQFEAYKVLSEI